MLGPLEQGEESTTLAGRGQRVTVSKSLEPRPDFPLLSL